MAERRVVRSLDVRSVARTAFALSLCLWGIAFVGFIALYILGLASGGLGGVEGFIASLGFTDFRLSILPFLVVFVVVAFVVSAFVGIAAGLMASLYNAVVPLIGGVEVVVDGRAQATAVVVEPPPVAPTQPPPSPPPIVTPPPPESRNWTHDVPDPTPGS